MAVGDLDGADPGSDDLGDDDVGDDDVRRLLVMLGAAMVATSQPVHEVEDELTEVARHFGHPDIEVAAGPTGVTLALASGAPATLESVTETLRLDQADDVRTIRHYLLSDQLSVTSAIDELGGIRRRPSRYPVWVMALGWVGSSVGIAMILQPNLPSLLVTFIGSVVVFVLSRLAARRSLLMTLLPTVASFIIACLVFASTSAGLLDAPLRSLLPPLAILLPGAVLVTGTAELAAGSMVAGGARLGYGLVQLLLFTLGIVAAHGFFDIGPGELANLRIGALGWWAVPVGLVLIGVGIGLIHNVRLRLLPWVLLIVFVTFAAQLTGQELEGVALGGFLGAIAASLGASMVELARPQLPRLVVFLPSFWLLVPGSLGLLSITQLAIDPNSAVDTGFAVIELFGSIAVGLLVGSAFAQAVRSRRPRQNAR